MIKGLIYQIKQNKFLFGLIVGLVVAVAVAYWWVNRPYTGPTGGAGQPNKNEVVLIGWDKQSAQLGSLGEIISSNQQQQLRRLLSAKIVSMIGQFDYLQPEIQDDVTSVYHKQTGVDQTHFTVKVAVNDQLLSFKVILDHNADVATVELVNDSHKPTKGDEN